MDAAPRRPGADHHRQLAGHHGTVESNVFQKTVDCPDEWFNGHHVKGGAVMPDPNIKPCENCGGGQIIDYDKSLYLVENAEDPCLVGALYGVVRIYTCNECSLIRTFLETPGAVKSTSN